MSSPRDHLSLSDRKYKNVICHDFNLNKLWDFNFKSVFFLNTILIDLIDQIRIKKLNSIC